MTKLLDIAIVWRMFRYFVEFFFGIYAKRLVLLNSCGINPTSSILDIGCGDGDFSKFFKGLYVGVDSSEAYINAAKINAAKNRFTNKFFTSSTNASCVTNNNFDCLLLMDVAHHLPEEVFKTILLEVKDLTVDKKIIFDPIENQTGFIGRVLCSLDRGKFIRKSEDIAAMVNACGYKIVDTKYFTLGPTDCVMIVFE